MKNKLIVLLISLICFIAPVSAQERINKVDMNVQVDDEGVALVTEEWDIKKQDNRIFTRMFNNAQDLKISDIKIVDKSLSTYKKVDDIKPDNTASFSYKNDKYKKYIYFTGDGIDKTVIIQYKIENIITAFSDRQAINWTIFSTDINQEIGTLNVYVSTSKALTEANTVMYAIGTNLSGKVETGRIHLYQSFINNKSDMILLANIAETKFTKVIKNKKDMDSYYKSLTSRSRIITLIIEFLRENVELSIGILVGVILVVIIIMILINYIKWKNPFNAFVPFGKDKTLGSLRNTPYHDAIPCGGDIYKMFFYSCLYNISKSRSNLIGAIMMKWIFDGILTIENENDKYSIKIKDGVIFDRDLDLKLYTMLKEASGNMVLDNNKLIRFALDNNEKVIDWYNQAIRESVRDEYLKRNITVNKKKILFNKVTHDDALKVQGLKRYLLNFNQVPRSTELNEQVYRYLIICSVLLGVDESFGKEILRKNPDNETAKKLLEFAHTKYLYENIYSQTMDVYKKGKHKLDKMLYNPAKKI